MTLLPLKNTRSSIGAPMVLGLMRALVILAPLMDIPLLWLRCYPPGMCCPTWNCDPPWMCHPHGCVTPSDFVTPAQMVPSLYFVPPLTCYPPPPCSDCTAAAKYLAFVAKSLVSSLHSALWTTATVVFAVQSSCNVQHEVCFTCFLGTVSLHWRWETLSFFFSIGHGVHVSAATMQRCAFFSCSVPFRAMRKASERQETLGRRNDETRPGTKTTCKQCPNRKSWPAQWVTIFWMHCCSFDSSMCKAVQCEHEKCMLFPIKRALWTKQTRYRQLLCLQRRFR